MASNKALKAAIVTLHGLDYKIGHGSIEEIAVAWQETLGDLTDDQLKRAVQRFIDTDTRGFWPKPGALRQLLIEAVDAPDPTWACDNCQDKGYSMNLVKRIDPSAPPGWTKSSLDGAVEMVVACGVCDATAPEGAHKWEDLSAQGFRRFFENAAAPWAMDVSTR